MTFPVQSTSAVSNGATNFTATLSGVAANGTLVLLVGGVGFADAVPTDGSGQIWVKGFYYKLAVGSLCISSCYYLLNANAGTHAVTFTTGASTFTNYTLAEYAQCSAVDVVGSVSSSNGGNPTSLSASVTTTNNADVVTGCISLDATIGQTNVAWNTPAGFTSIYKDGNSSADVAFASVCLNQSSSGTQTAAWTFNADGSGQDVIAGLISFKLSATAPVIGQTLGIQGPKFAKQQTGTKGSTVVVQSAVSAALTGVTGTGSVGTVVPNVNPTLSGLTATGSPGTVVANVSPVLTGISATGSVGTVTPNVALALTGVTGTGSVGTVGVNVAVGLTGVTGTGSVGTVTATTGFSVALTGVTGTGSVGTVVPNIDTALSAVSGTGSVGTVSPGTSSALTGVSATGSAGTVSPSTSAGLTGTAGMTSVGAVVSNVTVGLTGVTATGSAGTVTASSGATIALTAVSAAGSVSAPGIDIVVGLTGVSGVGTAGTVSVPPAPSTGHGGGDDAPKKKRIPLGQQKLPEPITYADIEAVQKSQAKPKSVVVDEDEEEILMLLL